MKKYVRVPTIVLFIGISAHLLAACMSPGATPPAPTTEPTIFPTSAPIVEPAASPTLTAEMATKSVTDLAEKYGMHPIWSEEAQRNYVLFLPAAYGNESQKKWPLILFLHSYGVRSDNIEYLKYEALPQILAFTPDFPFIAVIPQLTEDEDYWTGEDVVASLFTILEEVQENYSVDPVKIYLTGVSLGGNGVWEIGLMYPDRFAALVPVMGFYGDTASVEVPDDICDLKEVPIWAFHGAKDHIVPLFAEEDLVDALKACGGNAQLTVYPDGDHDISGEVYNNPDLYNWLLSQSLK